MELQKITVWMIDDHELFRDGVSLYLSMQSDIESVLAFSSPTDLHRQFALGQPNVLLMDINMPQQSGIDLTRQLLKEYPKLKILFISGNEAQSYLEQAMRAGGRGFIPKSSPKTDVLEAIRKVHDGAYYFPPSLAQDVLSSYVNLLNQTTNQSLSDRELEVLRCFANGLSFKEIGDTLHISKKTIEHHKKSIFDKLGFSNNADLVKYAIKHHIVTV